MYRSGTIIVEYMIDDRRHVDTWDGEMSIKYIRRVLENRNATNIKFRYAN